MGGFSHSLMISLKFHSTVELSQQVGTRGTQEPQGVGWGIVHNRPQVPALPLSFFLVDLVPEMAEKARARFDSKKVRRGGIEHPLPRQRKALHDLIDLREMRSLSLDRFLKVHKRPPSECPPFGVPILSTT